MNKSIIYKAKEDKDIKEDLRKLRALQQDTCEDCISREHLLEEIALLKESPWFKDNTNCAMAIRKETIEIVEDLCIRKEPSVNPQEPCEDYISRQALLKLMGEEPFNWTDSDKELQEVEDYRNFRNIVEQLPSVNPHQAMCDEERKESVLFMQDDLISRQAVIDTIYHECSGENLDIDFSKVLLLQRKIKALPSVNPQPEIIRCYQCKYAKVADPEDNQDGYTCQFHRGSIWFSRSYCSWAERRQDG